MNRILTHIGIQSPDLCHSVGQILLMPASLLAGRSFEVGGSARQLPPLSSCDKMKVAALSLVFWPFVAPALGLGALLVAASSSHQRAYQAIQDAEIQVVWKNGLPEIRTQRLLLRPIEPNDLPVYQKLFSSAVAMEKYAGGVRDITNRFNGWLERWKEHSFSALAVVEPKTEQVIGHVISGHGDYEGDFNRGFSEMAIVIDPAYWNAGFQNEAKGIGCAGKNHIGSEVARASVAYARALKERSLLVPSDVTEEQRPEVEKALGHRKELKVHRDSSGQIDWVYLPFTELRASAYKENLGGCKILEQVFGVENQAAKTPKSPERDLFALKL